MAAGALATILGRPVVQSSNMPIIAADAETALIDNFGHAYFIVDRQGLDVQRGTDHWFEQDLTAFRAIRRVDGQLALADAVRVLGWRLFKIHGASSL